MQKLQADAEPEFFKAIIDPVEVEGFFEKLLLISEMIIGIAERNGQAIGYVWCEL